jgi:hypothetical protein
VPASVTDSHSHSEMLQAAAAGPGLGAGIDVRPGILGRNGADPADLGEIPSSLPNFGVSCYGNLSADSLRSPDADLEPSFALNLFPDGYSVGALDKVCV